LPEAQIAVLIDYENVGLDAIQHLFDQLSDMGRIIVKRAYADWSAAGRRRDQVLELGIEAVHHFHAAKYAKNSSDISLAIDAVELLYRSPVDTFVIVSADSDFVSLVSKLRAAGKTVLGAGRRDVVSPTLVKSCDRYIFLDGPPAPQRDTSKASLQAAWELLARAMEAPTDSQGRVPGSKLHQTMTRIDPSFSFKDLGYSTFTKFLEASPLVKVTRSRGQGDIMVELRQPGQAGLLPKVSAILGKRQPKAPSAPAEAARETPQLPTPTQQRPEKTPVEQAPAAGQTAWDEDIHNAWSRRAKGPGDPLNGTWAAGEAARVLGVPKLSASRYKTLQKLLDASPVLAQHWSRDGNTLHRKG
jgi:uncharacterized protein (TIGR00288 family)